MWCSWCPGLYWPLVTTLTTCYQQPPSYNSTTAPQHHSYHCTTPLRNNNKHIKHLNSNEMDDGLLSTPTLSTATMQCRNK